MMDESDTRRPRGDGVNVSGDRMRRTTWWPSLPLAVGASTVAAGAAALALVVAATSPDARAGAQAAVYALAPHDDLWVRLLRGGLHWIALPFALALAGVALVSLVRHRRRGDAAVAAVVLLGANGTVQAVKHGLLGLGPSTPQLSGHMAVVVGAAFAVTLAAGPDLRRWVLPLGVAATAATGAGVALVAWHTVPEVCAPTLVAVAWVLACLPFVGRRRGAPAAREDDAVPVGARS
jgi:hypothetical protein